MPRKQPVLRCMVNPFVHVDEDGRPAAFVPNDTVHHVDGSRRLGCEAKHTILEARSPNEWRKGAGPKGDDRRSRQDTWFEFSHEPFTLPDTPHYRRMMLPQSNPGGPALIPANKDTARALGIPFREPALIIAETAKVAAFNWAKEHDGEIPEWAAHDGAKHASHACHSAFLKAHGISFDHKALAAALAPPAANVEEDVHVEHEDGV